MLSFTNKAFSRSLSKDKWKEMTTSYTQIKDTESFLVAPTMEAGMKEELKKRHGYTKTKELFALTMAWLKVNLLSWSWLAPC